MALQFTKRISKLPNNCNVWKNYTCPIDEFRELSEIRSGNIESSNNLNIPPRDWLNKLAPDSEKKIQSVSECEENLSNASLDLETYTDEDDVDDYVGKNDNLKLKLEKVCFS